MAQFKHPSPARPPAAATPAKVQEPLRFVNRLLLALAALVIVVAGLRAAGTIVVPCLLAVFVAVVLAPLYTALRRHRVPAGLALLLVVALLVALGVGLTLSLEQGFASLRLKFAAYQPTLNANVAALLAWLREYGFANPETLRQDFSFGMIIGYLQTIVGTVGDMLVAAFIVLIVTIFVLLEIDLMPRKLRSIAGLSNESWERVLQIVYDVRRYMLLKTVMSLLTGALIGLWIWLLGLDFPIMLGILAFLLNYIPTIGSIVAGVPGVFLALVDHGVGWAAITTAGYVAINVGISNGIEPRYFGYGLNLSPLVVLLSVIFWGWALGPLGMLLSVPLTMTVKITLESDPDTRWLALLMGAKPPPDARPD